MMRGRTAGAAVVVALAVSACVDALSISRPNHLASMPTAQNGQLLSRPIQCSPYNRYRSVELSMSAASSSSGERRSFRGRVKNTLNKIRGNNTVSKRERMRQKLMGLAVAFSALFFISTGKNAELINNGAASSAGVAAPVASTVSRGGGAAAATTTKSKILSAIFSKQHSQEQHGGESFQKDASPVSVDRTIVNRWDEMRGGGSKAATADSGMAELSKETKKTFREAIVDLNAYMKGPKSDTLFLLFATALITPLCKMAGTSPILGFLASGMLLGPNGLGVISGIHTTETLAELGIVFFLFEMGIELSVERLKSMKKDVFGLGLSQYTITAAVIGMVAKFAGGLSGPASVVVGGALSLSSSAFVLQLIKDKKELATRFGKAAFGVLLLQDLAVVPLLVATPILAGSGSLASALGSAVVKAAMALSGIALAGRFALNPLFKTVAAANSQEAFLGMILLTALGMSFLTEGLGLSNTLGAFLAGVCLSETKYRYQVEADIAPFRGILLGLFFVTVGFEIDVRLIANNLPVVSAIVAGILGLKAGILTLLSRAFGLSPPTAIRTGLILSQGGEFAFVAFGLARSLGILDPPTTKMLLTSVSLTMALTPFLDEMGGKFAKKMEEGTDFTHYMGADQDATEITTDEASDFVVVVGYGVVGKVVCDLLDRKLIKYVGMECDPKKAIQARNKGLPVFYGDVGRTEVAEAFNVGKAKAVIVTISDKAEATRAVIALRRMYPDKPIFARATDADHAQRLQSTLDVAAMVPILPEDNILLTLPFGGAVLRSLGAPPEEVNYILAEKRRELLSGKELEKYEEEAVLAQLGVEKPEEDGDDEEASDNEDEPKPVGEKKESAGNIKLYGEVKASSSETAPAGEEESPAVAKPKGEMKPLLKKVVEANVSPQKKKPIIDEKDGTAPENEVKAEEQEIPL
ncbi:hypothetical protein ACHAWT_003053 [Skeletonema menzelii]